MTTALAPTGSLTGSLTTSPTGSLTAPPNASPTASPKPARRPAAARRAATRNGTSPTGTSLEEAGCVRCLHELAHCHGIVVVHADGSIQCLEGGGCSAEATEHAFVGACAELFASCGCG